MVKQKPRTNKSSNDFLSAVKDIQRFTYEAMTSKEKRVEKANSAYIKKNPKMPIKMLQGIRGKALERQKNKEEEMRQGQILYDSSMKKYDLSWLESKNKKQEKGKKQHEYNSYKFKGANSQGMGKYKDGILSFSNSQIKKISKKKR